MKTKQIKALDGRVTFEIMQPTFERDERKRMAQDRVDEAFGDEAEIWHANLAAWLAVTVGLETDQDEPGLDDLREVWDMSRNGADLKDLCAFWRENIPHPIYNAWFNAYDESAEIFASPTEKPGHRLTEEERADPN